MAFVNEYIPKDDFEKYGIEAINQSLFGKEGTTNSRDWTIDRERNIYLRLVANPPRESTENIYQWTFFWKGTLLWFKRKAFGVEKKADGLRHAHSRITFPISEHLESHREEIYQDLRDAFRTYGGGGIFSTSTDYVHDLEFTA